MKNLMQRALSANPIEQTDLYQLVSDVIAKAQNKGATAVEVGASVDAGYSVTVRLGEIDVLEYHRDKGIAISVYFGLRRGSASTSDTSPHALATTIEKACHIAQFTSEDPCSGLPPAELMAVNYPELDLYFPWELSVEDAINLTREVEAKGMALDKRINNSEGASLNTHVGFRVIGNSLGFMGGVASSRHNISCALVAEANDQMERDYSYTVARDQNDLEDLNALSQKVAMRTVQRLGARRIKTQKVPVIFDSEIAPSIIGHFISAISGGSLYRNASFLLDHLGKKVFPDFLTFTEKPHLLKGLSSTPFDTEGVKTTERILVDKGILQGYVLSHYSAQKLKMQSTGNAGGLHNLAISTSNKNLSALLKQMDRGLLITEVMGQGVNIVTGDYSRGAFGFWVENGEIQYPVNEITIASNLKDMFNNIVSIGNDVNRNSGIQTGSILISEITVGGI
jgi:PmbA protein